MLELIDRQETLKKMCKLCGQCERLENAMRSTHPDFVSDKCNNYKFLSEQPTIEAEPVRYGHWIQRRNLEYYCSNCGREERHIFQKNYCPRCGVKMDLRTPTQAQLDEADSVMMGDVDNA